MGKLDGKVAIVTGAASGIGEAIARVYLAEGAKVVVSDLPGHGLTDKFQGDKVRLVEADVTADDTPAVLMAAAQAAFGGLDILVNNAGIALGKPFEETTDEEFDRIMAVNVRAVFRVSREAVPLLKARGGGRIINLASIMSGTGGPLLSAYGCSKHAVSGLTKGMACDLGGYGITVNSLMPGSIWTGLSKPFFADPGFRQYWEAKAPMGRIGDPEDVAVAALFLATDEARFVSGAGIAVDGGAAIRF